MHVQRTGDGYPKGTIRDFAILRIIGVAECALSLSLSSGPLFIPQMCSCFAQFFFQRIS